MYLCVYFYMPSITLSTYLYYLFYVYYIYIYTCVYIDICIYIYIYIYMDTIRRGAANRGKHTHKHNNNVLTYT